MFDEFSELGSFCFNGFELGSLCFNGFGLFFVKLLSFMYVLLDV